LYDSDQMRRKAKRRWGQKGQTSEKVVGLRNQGRIDTSENQINQNLNTGKMQWAGKMVRPRGNITRDGTSGRIPRRQERNRNVRLAAGEDLWKAIEERHKAFRRKSKSV